MAAIAPAAIATPTDTAKAASHGNPAANVCPNVAAPIAANDI